MTSDLLKSIVIDEFDGHFEWGYKRLNSNVEHNAPAQIFGAEFCLKVRGMQFLLFVTE